MCFKKIIKLTVLCLFFYIISVTGHLKDLGEKKEYFKNALKNIEKRIIGGSTTTLREFPFNVQFINLGGMCGGTILTLQTVLTAAHCFDHSKNIAEMAILSNPRFIFDHQATTHEVWDFVLHESYNVETHFANDIAIVMIHDNFKFSSQVQKATLPNTDVWMNENETFVATGWGETKHGEGFSKLGLKMANLNYVGREECMRENSLYLSPDMFCLYGGGLNDTCRGDSGGGVLWHGILVGITSHGRGCGEKPAMYVNVYYMKSWITENVKKLARKYCNFHNKIK